MAETTTTTESSTLSNIAVGLSQKPSAAGMASMAASGNWEGAAISFGIHALTFGAREAAAEATAEMAIAAGEYESSLVSLNMYNTLDLMARKSSILAGTQRAQTAASGFSITSQSALEIMNDSMRQTEREAYKVKQDADNRKRKIRFEADSAAATAKSEVSGGFYGSLF